MTPDFTQPHPDRRKATVNGCVLYLPWGISHVSGLWRVTVNNKQQYKHSLREAWINLQERRPKYAVQEPGFHGPRKALDTGVIGLRISVYHRKENIYVSVKVAQALDRGPRAVMIRHCPLDSFNQLWLNEALRLGAGVRWHYLTERKKHGRPAHSVKPGDVPFETFPTKPIRIVTVDQVLKHIDALALKAKG
jgi:hypothetical protein